MQRASRRCRSSLAQVQQNELALAMPERPLTTWSQMTSSASRARMSDVRARVLGGTVHQDRSSTPSFGYSESRESCTARAPIVVTMGKHAKVVHIEGNPCRSASIRDSSKIDVGVREVIKPLSIARRTTCQCRLRVNPAGGGRPRRCLAGRQPGCGGYRLMARP